MRMDYLNGIHKIGRNRLLTNAPADIFLYYVRYAKIVGIARFRADFRCLKTYNVFVLLYIWCARASSLRAITSISVEWQTDRVNIFWHKNRSKVRQLFRAELNRQRNSPPPGQKCWRRIFWLNFIRLTIGKMCRRADICLTCVDCDRCR